MVTRPSEPRPAFGGRGRFDSRLCRRPARLGRAGPGWRRWQRRLADPGQASQARASA